MKRIQDMERGPREKKPEPKPAAPVVVQQAQVQPQRRPPTARQVSEDDEIARIKRENKAASSSQAPIVVETERTERPTSILKKAPNADETTTEVSE
jgi:tripartite motif-containing protein 71